MAEYYEMKVAGLDRRLKKCAVSDKLDIAAFIMFGDVEVTVESAKQLLERAPEFDVILTAECKGIPLAYEMSRQSGKTYIVARKGGKFYLQDVISVKVRSITTANEQTLCMDVDKAALIQGKRVLLVDDVVSTGDSVRALEALVSEAGGTVAGKACVLAEGDAAKRDDLIFLDALPLFPRD